MSSATGTAVKWGILIGIANMAWLYGSYWAGLHTSGVLVFQAVPAVWFVMMIITFIFALRAVKRAQPNMGYLGGLGRGAIISLIAAIFAVIQQILYYKVIHPAWPTYMVEETRKFAESAGMTLEQVEMMVENAKRNFTVEVYAATSAIGAFVLGMILSAIIMIFLRRRSATA